ncbi:MAG: efflux RND transporter periplasmic adaptor subunit [Betaproteobacteria bacterium]|nr:efflux RND transporter periplasmic adaptor subunit [Betaproteobacteria bacterium]
MPAPATRRTARLATTLVIVAVLGAAAFAAWRYLGPADKAPQLRLAKVERGGITSTVSASGTLTAVTTVLVGSQISGQVREILVDFNSPVKKGQLLARIDPETFELKVKQADADLEAARTSLLQRESEAASQRSQIVRAQITHEDAKRDVERKQSLLAKNFISEAERDKAVFVERGAAEAVRTAQAQLRAAEAMVANAHAVVKQRQAALASARNDLSKTSITAPVDGVVISRQVEPGQTVAASLNTPTLFTIAQDLREMQVDVAIDESDIGRIRADQRVTFTVDAFPGRTFNGSVRQIRKAAQTVQNVVTYIVVVGTQNQALQLVPGMTANARIVTDQRDAVLKVPNAALRWRPAGVGAAKDEAAPAAAAGSGPGNAGDQQARRKRLIDELKLDAGQVARLDEIFAEMRTRFMELRELPEADRRPRMERIRIDVRQRISGMLNAEQQKRYAEIVASETGRGSAAGGAGRVFVPAAEGPKEVSVRTGLTDGNATEIVAGDLAEGQDVIVGTQQPAGSAAPRPPSGAPRLPF